MPQEAPEPARRLRALEAGTTAAAALAFWDGLPAVGVTDLVGRWAGRGVPTGHPLDGMLERLGWRGKVMRSPQAVHPLVFRASAGRDVAVDPTLLPLRTLLRVAPAVPPGVAAAAFRVVRPLLTTGRTHARLMAVAHRGVVSAAMVYDRLPVVDHFRRVDERTVLGVMDVGGDPRPYVFALERVD